MIFFDRFKINELIEEHGHKLLWLPPYYCHFNPTELGWSQGKRYYNSIVGQNGVGVGCEKDVGGITGAGLFFLFNDYQAKACTVT
jgi:hypothetical protein